MKTRTLKCFEVKYRVLAVALSAIAAAATGCVAEDGVVTASGYIYTSDGKTAMAPMKDAAEQKTWTGNPLEAGAWSRIDVDANGSFSYNYAASPDSSNARIRVRGLVDILIRDRLDTLSQTYDHATIEKALLDACSRITTSAFVPLNQDGEEATVLMMDISNEEIASIKTCQENLLDYLLASNAAPRS